MHLTIVSPYPPTTTGIGQYGYYMSQSLADSAAFDRITVLTGHVHSQNTVDTQQTTSGKTNVHIERTWSDCQPANTGWRVAARIRQLNPNVVWFNLGATSFGQSVVSNISGLLAPALVRRMGFPTVVTMHEMAELADLSQLRAPGGPFRRIGAHWVTRALTRADVVCVTLQRYHDWLSTHNRGGFDNGTRCIHIPIGMYQQADPTAEPQQPSLLFFSTIAPYKGLELLLQTFQTLQTHRPELTLTIAGVDHVRFPGYLAELRRTYSALNGVNWIGYVPENNVGALFRQSMVVVLPYSAATGSSSVLYQAMMRGRAIVASDLPELQSAVDEGGLQVGFFHSGNHDNLARALTKMLDSAEIRREHVAHNLKALSCLRPCETANAYLRAFLLAQQLHHPVQRTCSQDEMRGIPQVSTGSTF